MTEINLLPWRELRREQEKKLFTSMLVLGLIIAVIVVFLINYYASSLVESQTARNARLQTEINQLDRKIKEISALKEIRDGLISRMLIVQNLQSTRTLTVHLFDELIRVMPEGTYFTKVERNVNKVTVWGYTQSNTNISQLMRNIEKNVWIQDPSLTEIKKTKDDNTRQDQEFKLNFVLKPSTTLGDNG